MIEARISAGARRLGLEVTSSPKNRFRVIDVFTTQDGQWYPSDGPYSVSRVAVSAYHTGNHLGGSNHLYGIVLGKPGNGTIESSFRFWTPDYQGNDTTMRSYPSGWANLPISGDGSSFSRQRGERGPWAWRPLLAGGVDVVSGGGLPNRHHVSSFAVWQEVDVDSVLPSPPPPYELDGLEKMVHRLNERVANLEEQMESIADWLMSAPVEGDG